MPADPLALTPFRVKKLDDDSLAYLVPDADIKVDGQKMCVKVVVSTPRMDRERDILVAKGCRTDDHRKIPAVLVSHKKHWPAVARAEDPDGRYTVKCVGDELHATSWFHETAKKSKLAAQTFGLIDSGALRGVSPGFLTVPNAVHRVKAHDGGEATMYTEWNLVEISHVPIPMNPDAVVLAIEKGFGGESLVPELKDLLLPYVPEKKAKAVGGWDNGKVKWIANGEPLEELPDPPAPGDIDLSDADAVPLTPSTQFYHAIYQKAFDFLCMAQELGGVQEVARTKADARRISGLIGGVLDTCLKGHAGHVNEFPDQPGVPGGPNDDIAPEMMSRWRTKALEMWDDYRRAQQKDAVAAENSPDIAEAVKFLVTLANDRQQRMPVRAVAKQFAQRLSSVKMVSVPVEDDEELEWGKVAERLAGV